MIDLASLRAQFPGLKRQLQGKPLIYFDNAATTHKPTCVLQAMEHASTVLNANINRSVHTVGYEVSQAYEQARQTVASFIGAQPEQTIFTSGATDSLNAVAQSVAALGLQAGQRILVTTMEHHANLVPWQMVAQRTGAQVEAIPLLADGSIDLTTYQQQLQAGNVAIVGCPLMSNVLGTKLPVSAMANLAHQHGAKIIVDAAQAVPHIPIDVTTLGADAVAWSGHKLFAPTGIGVLWVEQQWLQSWPPWKGGGDMIETVSFAGTTFRQPPHRFEAGTPPIAPALALGRAVEWLQDIGWEAIQQAEQQLMDEMLRGFAAIPRLRLLAEQPDIPVFAFQVDGIHSHDMGSLLDMQGIAVRSGTHCTEPLHRALGISDSTRASLCFLNTSDECQQFFAALADIIGMFHAD